MSLFHFQKCRGSAEEANYITRNQQLIYRQQLKRAQTLSSIRPQLKSLSVTEYTVRLAIQSQLLFLYNNFLLSKNLHVSTY